MTSPSALRRAWRMALGRTQDFPVVPATTGYTLPRRVLTSLMGMRAVRSTSTTTRSGQRPRAVPVTKPDQSDGLPAARWGTTAPARLRPATPRGRRLHHSGTVASLNVIAVVASVLLITGGIALWGAHTNKDSGKFNAITATPSITGSLSPTASPSASASQIGNTVIIHCLAAQCQVAVFGPRSDDTQFNGFLSHDERRVFNEPRLIVTVPDASKVTLTINGRLQPRGGHGPHTYEVPSSQ